MAKNGAVPEVRVAGHLSAPLFIRETVENNLTQLIQFIIDNIVSGAWLRDLLRLS